MLLLEILDAREESAPPSWAFLVELQSVGKSRWFLRDLLKRPIMPLRRPDGARGEVWVGRGPDAHARIRDASISMRHARFLPLSGSRWKIVDEGSTNGTFVNGGRLAPGVPFEVGEGSIVRLGAKRCVFGSSSLQKLLSRLVAQRTRLYEETLVFPEEELATP